MQKLVVLQRQALRENDWLLDVLTEHRGRLRLVLNRPDTPPDLFTLYQADWQLTQEWPQIKGWQIHTNWSLNGTHLYCGFYLNELLVRLMPFHDVLPALFHAYMHTLDGLLQHEMPDPWLRVFEWQLLQNLGYGFSWEVDSQGRAITNEHFYQFIPGQGFVLGGFGYAGADILAFAQGARDFALWKMARVIFRKAIEYVLQAPLCSRELLIGLNSSAKPLGV